MPAVMEANRVLSQGELAGSDFSEGLAQALAESTCSNPFAVAEDLAVEYRIDRSGVCFLLDFEPTSLQAERGLVRCP